MKLKWFKFNNLPIMYKLIVHFLLISILPSIGLGLLIDWTAGRIIERQVNENTQQLIGKVNKTLESYAGNMQKLTYFISFDPEMKRFLDGSVSKQDTESNDHYEIRKFLQGFTTLYPEIAGLLVVNNRGEYISNEMYARSQDNLTLETWYREAVRNNGIFKMIGHPQKRNITNHSNYKDSEVVSVVRSILDPDTQKVQGVVLIDLKLRVIAETAKDVRLGKTGYLTVIDQNGENIYSPENPLVDKLPNELLDTNNTGNFSKTIDGKEIQFIFRKSPFTEWITVGVFSTKESVMEVQEIRFYVVSFVFIVCLLGIAASLFLSYSISRPIRQLMTFMHKAESGDLTTRYWVNRTDEVGMLGRSYNNMLAEIKNLLSLTELQERQKREAELRSLQAHIKPHFLYNTLDTIQWMARKRGAEDIAVVVESLSRLFRIGLSKGNDIIPLADELEHVQSYLKIQKTRYKDKLNYTLHVDPDLGQLSVIKLVLQPIVENAIYHGIKERRGPGHILLEAKELEGNLVMRISDDGTGIPHEKLLEVQHKLAHSLTEDDRQNGEAAAKSGYGMLNVQGRIKLTFGEPYGLSIESEHGIGTTVTIVHPLLKEYNRNPKFE